MSTKASRYDLSSVLQPFPHRFLRAPYAGLIDLPEHSISEIGAMLATKHLASHPGAEASARPRFASAGRMWSAANGIHAGHRAIIRSRNQRGFVRLVPDDEALAPYNNIAKDVTLLDGFRIPVDELLEQDRDSTVVLSSPNGTSGRIATVQEIVRLARHFALVVIDERLAPFSTRRLTPLVSEWENVISIQRFPFLMPGQTQEFGWIIHPSAFKAELNRYLAPLPDQTRAEVLGYGVINTFPAERFVARLKGQLYREMRKLSILSVPYPSRSNSLLARIERGDRNEIVQELALRGIDVYAPPHDNLRQHLRITAFSEEATMALKRALIEINREI